MINNAPILLSDDIIAGNPPASEVVPSAGSRHNSTPWARKALSPSKSTNRRYQNTQNHPRPPSRQECKAQYPSQSSSAPPRTPSLPLPSSAPLPIRPPPDASHRTTGSTAPPAPTRTPQTAPLNPVSLRKVPPSTRASTELTHPTLRRAHSVRLRRGGAVCTTTGRSATYHRGLDAT